MFILATSKTFCKLNLLIFPLKNRIKQLNYLIFIQFIRLLMSPWSSNSLILSDYIYLYKIHLYQMIKDNEKIIK